MPTEVLPLLSQITTASMTVFLASLCLIASTHKFSNLSGYKKIVEAYDILPLPVIGMAARGLPMFELLIGIAILVPTTFSVAAFAIAGLFTLYTIAMLSTILRGKALEDCGCGRPAYVNGRAQVLSFWHIIRNTLLVVMALWVASNTISVFQIIEPQTWLLVIPASVFFALLYWVADTLAANQAQMNHATSGHN